MMKEDSDAEWDHEEGRLLPRTFTSTTAAPSQYPGRPVSSSSSWTGAFANESGDDDEAFEMYAARFDDLGEEDRVRVGGSRRRGGGGGGGSWAGYLTGKSGAGGLLHEYSLYLVPIVLLLFVTFYAASSTNVTGWLRSSWKNAWGGGAGPHGAGRRTAFMEYRLASVGDWHDQSNEHLDEEWKFKIVQFADLHFGCMKGGLVENQPGVGEQRSVDLMRDILINKEKGNVDLVIFSGDQIHGDHIQGDEGEGNSQGQPEKGDKDSENPESTSAGEQYLMHMFNVTGEANVPWALVFGNHDDRYFNNSTPATNSRPHDHMTREAMTRVDVSHWSGLSKTMLRPSTDSSPWTVNDPCPEKVGCGNYFIPIVHRISANSTADSSGYRSIAQDIPATILAVLDTGGGSDGRKEMISEAQVSWFKEVLSSIESGEFNASVSEDAVQTHFSSYRLLVFMHIPSEDFVGVFKNSADSSCWGLQEDPGRNGSGIWPTQTTSGFFEYLDTLSKGTKESAGPGSRRRLAGITVFVGHNHGNNWCCPLGTGQLTACFGKVTGYNGYGKWDRGARVVEITIPSVDRASNRIRADMYQLETWIRLENGTVTDKHSLLKVKT
eukprot:Nk52_evm10s1400 gene=Nk52_evmTU10s1400